MLLLGLLFVPVLLGLAGLAFSKGRVTWKEFLVHEGVVLAIITIGYFIARSDRTRDVEVWNGVVARKWQGTMGCCHSYPCNCVTSCSGSGSSQSCTTICQTCYLHSHDISWSAVSSNGEDIYSDICNWPGSGPPDRWNQIRIGEPTAQEHLYTNYIRGNPDSLIRRRGFAERFKRYLPPYPSVFDHYRINRVLAAGVRVPNLRALNDRLSAINARLGPRKEVNIILVVTRVRDRMYAEGFREAWIGGKQNDLVVIVSAPLFPELAWVEVVSWTRNEDVKLGIRNRIMDIGSFDGKRVLDIIEDEVGQKFVRRPMADFEYLAATIEPSSFAKWTLFIIGLLLAGGLQIFFWKSDPFGDEFRRRLFPSRY